MALMLCPSVYTGLNSWQQILLHYSLTDGIRVQAAMMIDVQESTWSPNKVFGGVYEGFNASGELLPSVA